MRKILLVFTLFATVSFSGCLKKESFTNPKVPNYQPEIGVPLIKSRLTIKDFINEGEKGEVHLHTEPNGLYYLTYTDTAYSTTAANVVQIPDQLILVPLFPLSNNQSLNHTLQFQSQGTLTQADLKSGNLVMNINTTNLVENFTVTLTFPSILNKNTGLPFSISANSNMQANFSLTGNFAGYDIFFDANNSFNYSISITGASTGSMSADININNLNYHVLYGSFNDIPVGVMTGENKIDIFTDILNGSIYFANPSIEFRIANSFGVPVNINKQYLTSTYQDNTTDEIDAGDLEPIENKIIAPAPALGSVANTNLFVNNSNSTNEGGKVSLATALSKGPRKIAYGANPILTSHPGFIKDDSKLDIVGIVKLPFHGRVTMYAFQDTTDFNFQDIEELEFAEFIVGTENGLPLELNLQVYFVNSKDSYKKLDSMFVDARPLLKTPVVDSEGAIITPGIDKQVILFPKEKILNIANADKILIKAAVHTTNPTIQDVKIFNHSYLDLRISLHAKANIVIN